MLQWDNVSLSDAWQCRLCQRLTSLTAGLCGFHGFSFSFELIWTFRLIFTAYGFPFGHVVGTEISNTKTKIVHEDKTKTRVVDLFSLYTYMWSIILEYDCKSMKYVCMISISWKEDFFPKEITFLKKFFFRQTPNSLEIMDYEIHNTSLCHLQLMHTKISQKWTSTDVSRKKIKT